MNGTRSEMATDGGKAMKVKTRTMQGYAKVKKAAQYAGVSERTLRGWLRDGLRYIVLKSGRILIAYSAIDEYLARFEVTGNEIDAIVNEMAGGF
jgi:hypothetical protein